MESRTEDHSCQTAERTDVMATRETDEFGGTKACPHRGQHEQQRTYAGSAFENAYGQGHALRGTCHMLCPGSDEAACVATVIGHVLDFVATAASNVQRNFQV